MPQPLHPQTHPDVHASRVTLSLEPVSAPTLSHAPCHSLFRCRCRPTDEAKITQKEIRLSLKDTASHSLLRKQCLHLSASLIHQFILFLNRCGNSKLCIFNSMGRFTNCRCLFSFCIPSKQTPINTCFSAMAYITSYSSAEGVCNRQTTLPIDTRISSKKSASIKPPSSFYPYLVWQSLGT